VGWGFEWEAKTGLRLGRSRALPLARPPVCAPSRLRALPLVRASTRESSELTEAAAGIYSGEYSVVHFARDVGESEVASGVAEGQSLVIHAHQV
jgi:hypothetical protein